MNENPDIKTLQTDYDIIIIGGGLAGLISAILLAADHRKILLVERKTYPFHKVCGEYISNESLPFLKSIGFDPFDYGASDIKKLRVSSPKGKNLYTNLDLGGFGLSRFTMDNALSKIALSKNIELLNGVKVTDVSYENKNFQLKLNSGENLNAKLVIGSYGKRDVLDKKMRRSFIESHTKYMAVKYHVKSNYPIDEIGLDNFENGYCGIVKIEADRYNICYLYKRKPAYKFSSLDELQEKVLFKNPVIRELFSAAEIIPGSIQTINEISFAPKSQVQDHVLMCGDAAGLITPLCGNGMSMAIHGAAILSKMINDSGIIESALISSQQRSKLENTYSSAWKKQFSSRLFWGHLIQQWFSGSRYIEKGLEMIHTFPSLERLLISKTHGKVFR